MSLTLAANDRTLAQFTHQHFITVWSQTWMSMNSYSQRFNINKHITTCTKPLQKYSKYKTMKNLARTLSLFLIFSGKYYKSKTRNYVTELCYEYDLRHKKWQSINKTNQESKYLQFCRTKAYYVVQHTLLLKLLS